MKYKELTTEKRSAIIALRKIGYSFRLIAKETKVSKGAVQKTIERYSSTDSFKSRERCGRPKITNLAEDRNIVITSKRNRKLTAPEITAHFNTNRSTKVSVDTVKRRLRNAGLFGRVAVKKPFLRKENMKKRLKWAHEHKNWSLEQWKNVLWTDESKFEIFGSKKRTYVRRKPGERMMNQCVVPKVKHGGGSVMVWGCFGNNKVGDLFKINGILRKEQYNSILIHHAVPSGLRLIGQNFIFQQDNDPKHTSKLCLNYLDQKSYQNVLKVMKWPAQSPDLNPIEKLWEELDRKVRIKCPTSESHMWELCQEAWNKIDSNILNKLINRMSGVCSEVIKKKGGYIDENKI